MTTPARRAAYEVLLRVFEQDAYADRAFRTAAEGLEERERAFAQRLAYGSAQRVRTLDYAIETVVRLVHGEPPEGAEATDVPGAYRVECVEEQLMAKGRIWPQSRGSQLAGLCVGAQDGERVLDLCAAPGGKTGQLRGEVTAVEIDPGRARELRENLATMPRTDVVVLQAAGTALPSEH